MIEPILPTNYHIAYQSIEANRQEVNKENIFIIGNKPIPNIDCSVGTFLRGKNSKNAI